MDHNVHSTVNSLADGDAAVRFLREQEAIRRARVKHRWITFGAVLAGLFVLMVGCGIAVGAAASGGNTASTSTPAPSAATEVPAVPSVSASSPAPERPSAATTAPAPVAQTAPVGPFPPAITITEGMWHAPDEIEAGTYRTTGRAADETYKCMITTAGPNGDIADYQSAETGPLRITVAAGQTVTVEGCAPLTKVG